MSNEQQKTPHSPNQPGEEQSYQYQFTVIGNIAVHGTSEALAYEKVKALLAHLNVEHPDLGYFTLQGIEADLDSIEAIETEGWE